MGYQGNRGKLMMVGPDTLSIRRRQAPSDPVMIALRPPPGGYDSHER
jgi:hypothetical protein